MDEFDFSKPINVTVIFEDDDANSNSCSILNEYNDSIIEENNRKEYKNADSEENEIINVRDEDTTLLSNENTETTEISTISNLTNSKNYSRNSQLEVTVNTKSRKRKLPATIENNARKIEENQDNQTHHGEHENIIDVELCLKSRPDKYERSRNHTKRLLTTLSGHIITIINSYIQLQKHKHTLKDIELKNKADMVNVFVKDYYLNLSYGTLESVILPQLNNTEFINTFLDDTLKMASNNDQKTNINREQMSIVFKQIVEWAQGKKNRNNKMCGKSTGGNSILKEQLNQPPKLYPTITSKSHNSNKCIFTSGPPGRELTMSLDPCKNKDQQMQNIRSTDNLYKHIVYNNNCKSFERNLVSRSNHVELCRNTQPLQPSYQRFNNFQSDRYDDRAAISRTPHITHRYYSPPNYYQQPMEKRQRNTRYSTESMENYHTTNPNCGDANWNIMNGVRHEEQLMPIVISDVISLNQDPSHMYNSAGPCHLCGKYTPAICHGCCNYYCSNICEQLDLQSHKAVCQKA